MDETARLISRSCTTGWADWIHGELWLLPRHLVRRRLTLRETRANKDGRTVPVPLPEVPASSLALRDITSAHRTNKVIPLDEVAEARLHRGILTDRLALKMDDGSRHKLLWLKVDPAHEILGPALGHLLGARFTRD
ncbi:MULTISPECIES: hypothetical protein [unclassified Micromonospora]|uniref:hypothetical protein n=1 Tax=unclassified Micromonospora TaxID=2617518 RepID=UPI0022B6C1D0|nr:MULTISPECIES: hypothetical protein [unclassified Micromonospora]MCZ7423594.1 hypothetical protein [Verrucosispora sp. WMMA2121]WBB91290.1 hypothetical protein O7597_30760 [Verrucosispora sp. WMMC514]